MKVRFCTGSDFLSKAISFGERDGWPTHCEAVLPDGSMLGAHLDGGVEIRPAGYDKATLVRELIVDLPTMSGMDVLWLSFLHNQVGKPYDITAIAGLALDRDWREDDSWFCSELVAAALEYSGYMPTLSSANNHISPRDLLLVLSGKINIPNAA